MGFDRDAYATRIKSLRKKSGLTQEQLAEKNKCDKHLHRENRKQPANRIN